MFNWFKSREQILIENILMDIDSFLFQLKRSVFNSGCLDSWERIHYYIRYLIRVLDEDGIPFSVDDTPYVLKLNIKDFCVESNSLHTLSYKDLYIFSKKIIPYLRQRIYRYCISRIQSDFEWYYVSDYQTMLCATLPTEELISSFDNIRALVSQTVISGVRNDVFKQQKLLVSPDTLTHIRRNILNDNTNFLKTLKRQMSLTLLS